MSIRDAQDLVRIHLDPPLPCALNECGKPATSALAERDEGHGGLWHLLPLCDACAERLGSN